ncbi:hypothetical protein F6475_12325 [Vibrio alginolyticus]|nr:hypothetical protein F6475_12325 [Vibrio alginolyticus]
MAYEVQHLTICLRGIRNAWHSKFKLALVFTGQSFRLGGIVAPYLTRRYKSRLRFVSENRILR